MTSSFNTILVIGATSGIGEAFAKRFHSQGKKVIATGRRQDRLQQLEKDAPGLKSYVMDNADLENLPKNIDTLFKEYPDIDTVWVNSGLQHASSIKDISTSSDAAYQQEIALNITAPFIIARHVVPRLLSRSSGGTFMITSSGLGFGPMPIYPVYNGTKFAVHGFLVSLRQALKDSNVNIIEMVPPYVGTELDAGRDERFQVPVKPMPLEEYVEETFKVLDNNDARSLKEVAVGSALDRVNAWRGGVGEWLKKSGMTDERA